jgi:hypothetical protein
VSARLLLTPDNCVVRPESGDPEVNASPEKGRRTIPRSAPPKMHANMMQLIVRRLIGSVASAIASLAGVM